MEQWKDIPDYEGWYQVSNLGRVRSVPRIIPHKTKGGVISNQRWEGKILRPTLISGGYEMVVLTKHRNPAYPTVHRLVAMAFVPNPYNKTVVNHIDGNKTNNVATNLEWVTSSENNQHAYDTGLKKRKRKAGESIL